VIDFDYCLHSIRIRPDLGQIVSGSTRAKLNQEIARKILIPLPPLPEQKRIATILKDKLTAIEEAKAKTEAQLEAAQTLSSSFLCQTFPQPDQELPNGWQCNNLGNIELAPY
jgi:type I restriction enzyme S subunit